MASGALRNEIETILKTMELLDHFRTIIAAEDVTQGKPEPKIYLKALAALNARGGNGKPIDAADCAVIEDSKGGIRGARRASMKCLAVTNSHTAELLLDRRRRQKPKRRRAEYSSKPVPVKASLIKQTGNRLRLPNAVLSRAYSASV